MKLPTAKELEAYRELDARNFEAPPYNAPGNYHGDQVAEEFEALYNELYLPLIDKTQEELTMIMLNLECKRGGITTHQRSLRLEVITAIASKLRMQEVALYVNRVAMVPMEVEALAL